MRNGLTSTSEARGDHERAEHEEDDRDADPRRAEERVEPVGDRRADDAPVPLEPGDDREEEADGEEAEAEELVVPVGAARAARASSCARAQATSGEPETDASSAPCSGVFRGAVGPLLQRVQSEATRSQRSSRNPSASMSTPTSAFGSFPVRRQRSTTVRPRQSCDSQSTSTWRCSVSTIPGRSTWATATASWIGAPSVAVRAPVVLDEEVVELGDHAPVLAGPAEALGVGVGHERLVGDVEPDHRHAAGRSGRRARPPRGRRRC